ncbi:hypothetical protein EXS57_02740 [Candidatus Kaiserbacteria bacterium]|nr:hypothetical protein [Candidatus Kaiserbacteria bacterium]
MRALQKITGLLPLFILICFSQPALVFATSWEKTDSQTNQVHVRGTCTDKQEVTVYLFTGNGTEPIYNAGAHCVKGIFDYVDDLAKWNLPEGTYRVMVGEGQSGANFNHVEDVVIDDPILQSETALPSDPNSSFENQAGNVVTSMQSMSQSIDVMIQSLDNTTFSSPLKAVFSGLLNSIKTMLVGVTEAVFHLQKLLYGAEHFIDNNAIDPIITTLATPISDTATSSNTTTVDIDGTSIVTTSNATSSASTETTNTDDSSMATSTPPLETPVLETPNIILEVNNETTTATF